MKKILLQKVKSILEQEFERALLASKLARSGSRHSEAEAKSKYETQSTELSYLADGQAMQAAKLDQQIKTIDRLMNKDLSAKDRVELGSIVYAERKGIVKVYFILSVGAGTTLKYNDETINIISFESPFGSLLKYAEMGDEIMEDCVVKLIK